MNRGVTTRPQTELATKKSELGECSSAVSFVQVCQNELRSLTFCNRATLEYLYQSGQANYAFKNCPAIDVYGSIKVVKREGGDETCHPLLVSVKNWTKVTKSSVDRFYEIIPSRATKGRRANGPYRCRLPRYLVDRSSDVRLPPAPHSVGMVPLKSFPNTFKSRKSVSLAANADGMGPRKRFPGSKTVRSLDKSTVSGGRVPSKKTDGRKWRSVPV